VVQGVPQGVHPSARETQRHPEEESIAAALTERLSPRAVARLLKVSRETIRRTLKKSGMHPAARLDSPRPTLSVWPLKNIDFRGEVRNLAVITHRVNALTG
jgi:hypothetical protein